MLNFIACLVKEPNRLIGIIKTVSGINSSTKLPLDVTRITETIRCEAAWLFSAI